MQLERLKEPFPEKNTLWRIQRAGFTKAGNPWAVVLCYVDARAIMDRLDDVVGPLNWTDTYTHLDNGVLCRISIRDNNGNWITKEDGSPETKVEAFKGGISKAFVRCAVKWGIGRYLYNLPQTYAECILEKFNGYNYANVDGKAFYWKNPKLPVWALPRPEDKNQNVKDIEKTNDLFEKTKDKITKLDSKEGLERAALFVSENKSFDSDELTQLDALLGRMNKKILGGK